MYKQCIFVRKDLNMSHGKMAAQVAHASMAFITSCMKRYHQIPDRNYFIPEEFGGGRYKYEAYIECPVFVKKEVFDEWINGSFTKIILQAKNRNKLLKVKELADNIGLIEGKDYFMIKDNCQTELEPEEVDEDGVGRTLTCIGFAPMEESVIDYICKKYHLYVD